MPSPHLSIQRVEREVLQSAHRGIDIRHKLASTETAGPYCIPRNRMDQLHVHTFRSCLHQFPLAVAVLFQTDFAPEFSLMSASPAARLAFSLIHSSLLPARLST